MLHATERVDHGGLWTVVTQHTWRKSSSRRSSAAYQRLRPRCYNFRDCKALWHSLRQDIYPNDRAFVRAFNHASHTHSHIHSLQASRALPGSTIAVKALLLSTSTTHHGKRKGKLHLQEPRYLKKQSDTGGSAWHNREQAGSSARSSTVSYQCSPAPGASASSGYYCLVQAKPCSILTSDTVRRLKPLGTPRRHKV